MSDVVGTVISTVIGGVGRIAMDLLNRRICGQLDTHPQNRGLIRRFRQIFAAHEIDLHQAHVYLENPLLPLNSLPLLASLSS
ncbi:MAG: hypothetical protein KDA96_26310 [Planctomycetaceae bacterium]|nr:hypothetical protein [Planctomycetaceae bacterium]